MSKNAVETLDLQEWINYPFNTIHYFESKKCNGLCLACTHKLRNTYIIIILPLLPAVTTTSHYPDFRKTLGLFFWRVQTYRVIGHDEPLFGDDEHFYGHCFGKAFIDLGDSHGLI